MRNVLLIILALTVLNGCAQSSTLIKTANKSTNNDIFQELSNSSTAPKGYADLRIAFSLKTPLPGIYRVDKKKLGTPEYTMLVNIDGQVVRLLGELQSENAGIRAIPGAEAGDGMRYRFIKSVRLKAGSHRIILAFPEDDIAIQRDISLGDGSSNSLLVEPVYGAPGDKQRPGFTGVTSFREGLKGARPILNGQSI
jgi:hypothetical protein